MASSTRQTDRALQRVYDRLPPMDCKGLCWPLCDGEFHMSARERERIAQKMGRPLEHDPTRGVCTMLDRHGRCSAYEVRPLICRIWGMSEPYPCQWGCVPEGERISTSRQKALFREVDQIGGVPPDRQEKRRRQRIIKEHHFLHVWDGVPRREANDALRDGRLPDRTRVEGAQGRFARFLRRILERT